MRYRAVRIGLRLLRDAFSSRCPFSLLAGYPYGRQRLIEGRVWLTPHKGDLRARLVESVNYRRNRVSERPVAGISQNPQ